MQWSLSLKNPPGRKFKPKCALSWIDRKTFPCLSVTQQRLLVKWMSPNLIPPQFSSVKTLSHVWLFATQWTKTHQASLSIINPRSLLKLMSIESVMTANHLILCSSVLPSLPAFNLSQHHSLSKCVSSSHWVVKVLEFQLQHQSFQWLFRADFL